MHVRATSRIKPNCKRDVPRILRIRHNSQHATRSTSAEHSERPDEWMLKHIKHYIHECISTKRLSIGPSRSSSAPNARANETRHAKWIDLIFVRSFVRSMPVLDWQAPSYRKTMHIEHAFYSQCSALKVCHGQIWHSVVSLSLSDSVVAVVDEHCVRALVISIQQRQFAGSDKIESRREKKNRTVCVQIVINR